MEDDDHDQFPAWASPQADLEHILSDPNGPGSNPAVSRATWSEPRLVASPPTSTQFMVEASASGIVRSPLQPPTSSGHVARPLPQRRTASASQVSPSTFSDQGLPATTFEPPLRSIFVSGPPTASVSANTAQASLSGAVTSSTTGPLAALTNASGSRRSHPRSVAGDVALNPSASPVSVSSRPALLKFEKDVDDPTTSGPGTLFESTTANTSAALARLFVPTDGASPTISRGPSHMRTLSSVGRDTTSLTGHLFHNGFEQGRHSDVTIVAFGLSYRLHKLLLDRVPYFSSAFSGAWAESSTREMRLSPEEIDANITQKAFELALKRIYGAHFPVQEEEEAVGLFATACWLDMPELVDSCVDSILRQMQPATLHSLIRLVTTNYYGKAGDRILSSAKAMLCREGWEMPYEYWDEIPAEIIREIVGGDPFFIPGEWDRWYLAVKLLNRRLRAKAVEASLVSPGGRYLHPKPTGLRFYAVRSDTPYKMAANNRYVSEKDDAWINLYMSPEVAPLLVLLDEGIHYVHLRFEQLQQIRAQRDILGIPVLPDQVISDALWMSMELRQRVLNAAETDVELGLSEQAEDYEEAEGRAERSEPDKGKWRDRSEDSGSRATGPDAEAGSSGGTAAKPRKFWIPAHDVSCVMGGTREACVAANSTSVAEWTTHAARLSASLEPTDVAWALDFNPVGVVEGSMSPARAYSPTSPPRYSHYPPFRFSAEFPNPRTLKEKKRVYSQTVWYAGSMWNLYIQRVNSSKAQQLGIYLHRAKDKDPCDDPLAQFLPATVDDRIGQLEREMLLRKNERRNQSWRLTDASRSAEFDRDEDAAARSAHEYDSAALHLGDDDSGLGRAGGGGGGSGLSTSQKMSQTPDAAGPRYYAPEFCPPGTQMVDSDEDDEELLRRNRKYNVSATPPYMDQRPTIRTYFKIYAPSKAGRLLSIYESAPDKFDVSKSWGWKSSQMQLDDGIGDCDASKSIKDGKLRYMVVIGNI